MRLSADDAAQAVTNLLQKKDTDGDLVAAVFEFTFGVVATARYDDETDEVEFELSEGFEDLDEETLRADWDI